MAEVEEQSITPGTAITAGTTIDALCQALFATRSANLSGAATYTWIETGLLQASWPGDTSVVRIRFESRQVPPNVLQR